MSPPSGAHSSLTVSLLPPFGIDSLAIQFTFWLPGINLCHFWERKRWMRIAVRIGILSGINLECHFGSRFIYAISNSVSDGFLLTVVSLQCSSPIDAVKPKTNLNLCWSAHTFYTFSSRLSQLCLVSLSLILFGFRLSLQSHCLSVTVLFISQSVSGIGNLTQQCFSMPCFVMFFSWDFQTLHHGKLASVTG